MWLMLQQDKSDDYVVATGETYSVREFLDEVFDHLDLDWNIDGVEEIHKKMDTLLGRQGAKLDALYYCPHHPDKGYPEENPKYRIECDCRKPKTGLITKAQEEFNIDLAKSYFIGDSDRDIACGKNARLITIGLTRGKGCGDDRRAARTTLSAACNRVLMILVGLCSIPLALAHLENERFGILMTIIGTVQMILFNGTVV